MADPAPTFRERLDRALEMARAGALRSEIVRETRLSADQVGEIVARVPGRICDTGEPDRDPDQIDLVDLVARAEAA